MATAINKEEVSISRTGMLSLRVEWLFQSRREALRDYPRVVDGLGFAGARGAPMIGRDGRWTLVCSYEGLMEDPRAEEDVYELSGEEKQLPIESFPDRELLREEFGGYVENDLLMFPEKIKKPSRLGGLLNLDTYAPGDTGEIDNPMHGCREYVVEYQVAVWRLVRKKTPQSLASMVGTVQDRLPAGFPPAKKDAKWYVRPLRVQKRGGCVSIEVQFKNVSPDAPQATIQTLLQRKQKGRGEGMGTTTFGL